MNDRRLWGKLLSSMIRYRLNITSSKYFPPSRIKLQKRMSGSFINYKWAYIQTCMHLCTSIFTKAVSVSYVCLIELCGECIIRPNL